MEPNPREAEIVRLRDAEGLSWREIGERPGTHQEQREFELQDREGEGWAEAKPNARLIERSKPGKTAAVLDAALDPFTTIRQAAEACSFPRSTLNALLKRMNTR